jgi:hypothetical protein
MASVSRSWARDRNVVFRRLKSIGRHMATGPCRQSDVASDAAAITMTIDAQSGSFMPDGQQLSNQHAKGDC